MSKEMLEMWLDILPFVAAGILFVWMLFVGRRMPGSRILRAYEEFSGYLAGKSRDSNWYRRTQEQLGKNGAQFHFGQWVHPTSWLALCVVMAGVGFVIGLQINIMAGGMAAVVGYLLPMILMRCLNFRDNERMLSEIKLIYNGLEMQLQAGVYVTDALTEMYAGVQDARLRKALLDLAGAVTVKADVYEALAQFQSSFDNRYIDALCITLIQAMESGQAVELLRDIAEQVKDMEVSVMSRKKASLDRSVTFYQLGILAAVLGVVLYACVTQMFAAALNF